MEIQSVKMLFRIFFMCELFVIVLCQDQSYVDGGGGSVNDEIQSGENSEMIDNKLLVNTDRSDILSNQIENSEEREKIEYENVNPYDNGNSDVTEIPGGSIATEKIIKLSESPLLLRTDLEVERGARLIIEPGVTIQFAPMVGITVKGIILAIGTPDKKITLTTQQNSNYKDTTSSDPLEVKARLVDGPTPLAGRLQIYNKGKWRSVCSNSRNWTISDYETVCRQMGYKGGRFWNWMERTQFFEPRLLMEEPKCRGNENTLFDCNWKSRQIGSGVCEYHSDLGVQCLPLLDGVSPHWRGIRFERAETKYKLSSDNVYYNDVSSSELRHVNVIKAGAGRERLASSAIEVLGVPPILSYVTIDHSAFTGINVTRHEAGFTFKNVTVRRSKGFGIFVNSSHGSAHLEGCTLSDNGADGVRYIGHDLRAWERTDRNKLLDFCSFSISSGQTYPLLLSFEQSRYDPNEKVCQRLLTTKPGHILTFHFVYFEMKKNESGRIELFDGNSETDRSLAVWSMRNFTRPQSVMSTKAKMFIRLRADGGGELLAHFRVTAAKTKAYDLNVTSSHVVDNGGRGIAIDNLRSQIHVHSSFISNNGHVAGIHVTSGAGDVNVTESRISFNQGDGINITYTGGNRNISRSTLSSNKGYGMAVWLNQTEKDREEFVAFNQTTTVEYSQIFRNLEVGIRHGNFCGDIWVNITGNEFRDGQGDGVDVQTCWFKIPDGRMQRLQIGHNMFVKMKKLGVKINPALNIEGKIEYNHFLQGKYGALLIRNEPLDDLPQLSWPLPARIVVQYNQFHNNKGIFVVSLGLTPNIRQSLQSILFTRNFVQKNRIEEPFGPSDNEASEGMNGEGRLNPRSRVAAPIVVSSSNVDIWRNIISNPDSKYEVGSHLLDQSKILNVTFNWLGNKKEEIIYKRIFHRKDRYDLAKIEYYPFLLHHSNPGTPAKVPFPNYIAQFYYEGSDTIGGEVDGQETLPAGTYNVERDINIRPGGKLILKSGTTLNFMPSVGMMIAGKLEAIGHSPDDILFTLKREPVMMENDTTEAINEAEMLDMVETEANLELPKEPEIPRTPVRLVGGLTDHEGRLQVYISGRWGTVCDYGWTITNAALVCHQLGLTLNPNDWRIERADMPGAGASDDVILSNIRCTEHDLDVTKCRAEHSSEREFENSCPHDNDVGVRCYEGAWAGLRFGALADRADLQYVTVEKAGLLDYTTNAFKPALQIDFARHNFDNIRVVQNLHDGLGIIYSDIYSSSSVNNVRNSEFSSNRGNGISLKQLGLKIQGSIIKDNRGSGIHHDPVISALDQREITGYFTMVPEDYDNVDSEYHPIMIPGNTLHVDIDQWSLKHLITVPYQGEPIENTIALKCQPGYVVGIQLLNPIENRSTEEIWIYDSASGSSTSDIWQVKRDLSVFPLTTSSFGAILKYKSGTNAVGGVVIALSSISAPIQNVYNKIVKGPVPTLMVKSTKIQRNYRGLTATYYNRYLGEKGEHYLRKANESIKLVKCEISHNREEAFLIHSPFWDVHESNISEITIHVNNSMIRDNGKGIRQFSKDLRSSNNLFHYALQGTTFEANLQGGFDISLPYVWQYNENFTHSIFLGNVTWQRNQKFGIMISGHYASVNITSNTFTDNLCASGLIGFRGMEKKLKIDYNKIMKNSGKYMVEFRSDSQSEILGEVHALFAYNDIRNNQKAPIIKGEMRGFIRGDRENDKDPTCVLGFGGIQKVKIYRNTISDNDQDYDLIAGIKSARLNNFVDVRENWWGSSEVEHIRRRIFDFDDWNNHAEVLFQPFLIEDSVDGSTSASFSEKKVVDLDNIGGKITQNLHIYRRIMPYVIKQDITVMPDVKLYINPGVIMDFAPNVGILVLGQLLARGTRDAEIVMRPIANSTQEQRRIERSVESLINYDTIRLCTNRNCSYDENEVDRKHEGFLEYFNHTTLQWIPICDRRFTERNAQVVCRELGYDPLDVFFDHDSRIEFHTNSFTRIWSWVEPKECSGDENRLEECPERLNGQLYGRHHECQWDSRFVFISCNREPDTQAYWGGVRFANADFENSFYEHRIHDSVTHETVKIHESHMEFVRVERAGILHREKSPALQTITKNPNINFVKIKDSAHHAVNLISPSESIYLNYLSIENALGNGINAISLTGEGRESDESSFNPLKNLDLPYNLFSLVDICDTTKELTLEERMIVYYKYDNNPVNCVKIFKSAYRVKPLGFRLLQSNLFNHSKEYGRRDAIHLFDGDIYNVSSSSIGVIDADANNHRKLFKTVEPILSVRLIASGAPARHGFIAEIVTLPISAIGFNRDAQHNISNSEIKDCRLGAMSYYTAGEVSPVLTLEKNRFINNGKQLYGNFSTCDAAIKVDVQNLRSLYFRNNLVEQNQGGLSIRADASGSATSLKGLIHYNLFYKNKNRPSLYVEGRTSSPYQDVIIHNNYFTQNDAAYDDAIVLRQVVSNFSYNYVHSNKGGRIIEISGFDKVRLPIYQTTSHNGFYDNVATDWHGRATIVAGTAGQHYVDNIFANPENDYEMITVNRSIFEFQFWNSTIDLWKTKIDATMNYWSYNGTLAVGSRIRDRADDQLLLEVQYLPLHMNNLTILDGKCPPGWTLVIDTCFMYVGAPMSFYEAREFCRSDNASLPFIQGDTTELLNFIQRSSRHLKALEKIWIQHLNFIDRCTAYTYRSVEVMDCDEKNAFICEIDPKVEINPLFWQADVVTISVISAFILALLLFCILSFCWYSKSKHRQLQRFERRNSIRQSLRSLNSIDPTGSIRRRNYAVSRSTDTLKSTTTDYKKMTSNGSIDSMNKSVLSSETEYDMYDKKADSEYASQLKSNMGYHEAVNPKYNGGPSDEYEITSTPQANGSPNRTKVYGLPDYSSQPGSSAFELAFRNEGYRDNSTTYSNATRNNSISTNLNDDTPIIHHQIDDDLGSDFYGNSSTLPMRARGDNLSFLNELKHRLPEYEPLPKSTPGHSSFLPPLPPEPPSSEMSIVSSGTLPYEQKVDRMRFTPPDQEKHTYQQPSIQTRRPNAFLTPLQTIDVRRPESYMRAVKKYATPGQERESIIPPQPVIMESVNKRPRTLYESSGEQQITPPPQTRSNYSRSKSEALLETNFDDEIPTPTILNADSRSYSQPLETAM